MSRRFKVLSALMVGVIALVGACTVPTSSGSSTAYQCDGPEQDPAGPVHTNERYGPDVRHIADIYPACTSQAVGTLMYIHGGSYTSGSKISAGDPIYQRLREQGWAIVAINYRYAPVYHWPAQPNDVQRAINWWRTTGAAEFDAPAAPLVGIGWSAGGQLAEFNNVQDSTAGFDGSVSLGGATYWPDRSATSTAISLFGGGASDSVLAAASTVTHLDPSDPPLLHIHATNDNYVYVSQANLLQDAITAHGNPSKHSVLLDPSCGHSSSCLTPARIDPFLAKFATP